MINTKLLKVQDACTCIYDWCMRLCLLWEISTTSVCIIDVSDTRCCAAVAIGHINMISEIMNESKLTPHAREWIEGRFLIVYICHMATSALYFVCKWTFSIPLWYIWLLLYQMLYISCADVRCLSRCLILSCVLNCMR